MATFEGSFQEFHDHLGPRIRNLVNGFARKGRNARNGVCEECQKTGQELDSAHVHGRDRRTIIETVLFRYLSGGVVRCIIKEAESEILAEHGDIREAFKFLCKECHVEYDRRQPQQKPIEGPAPLQTPSTRLEVQFFPDNEKLFKDLLIARKKAYVVIYKVNGVTEPIKEWKADHFAEHSSLRKNIFSGPLRGWQQKGIIRAVYAIEESQLRTQVALAE